MARSAMGPNALKIRAEDASCFTCYKLKYMKRFFQTFLFAAMITAFCSCEEEKMQKDGAWDPVELDKSHVEFPSEGGQNTVVALNYTRWWINGGYEVATQVGGHIEYTNYIHATSSGGEQACTYDVLDGGWYRVVVPEQGKSNTVIITVDPHDDAKPRRALVEMQAGNAFAKFSISQR